MTAPHMDTLAPPPFNDLATIALERLVAALAEDGMFALSGAIGSDADGLLEGLAKRRGEAYGAIVQGSPVHRMTDRYDYWLVDMVRALAPIAPPTWLPMSDVLREKVTLEIGARGLRSLFSSKPSDKDTQRVKRLGTLAVRITRAVLASDSDGKLEPEEERTIAALIGALGLPQEDAAPLYTEAPVDITTLEVYGELEPAVAMGLLRGAWLAAAWDAIDPREEEVIRTVGRKLSVDHDVEAARAEALARVEARRGAGVAAVDAIRHVLSDRVPGPGAQLAASAGMLMLPRRYRDETLAQIGHGAPVTLAKRHSLTGDTRAAVLAVTWCAALRDDPSLARRAILRARYDRVAADLGEDGTRPREAVDQWIGETLATFAETMR